MTGTDTRNLHIQDLEYNGQEFEGEEIEAIFTTTRDYIGLPQKIYSQVKESIQEKTGSECLVTEKESILKCDSVDIGDIPQLLTMTVDGRIVAVNVTKLWNENSESF